MSFEQAAENAASDYKLGLVDTATISQAISLKRIADALDKLIAVPTMPALTPEEIERIKELKPYGFIVNKS